MNSLVITAICFVGCLSVLFELSFALRPRLNRGLARIPLGKRVLLIAVLCWLIRDVPFLLLWLFYFDDKLLFRCGLPVMLLAEWNYEFGLAAGLTTRWKFGSLFLATGFMFFCILPIMATDLIKGHKPTSPLKIGVNYSGPPGSR
jgi:hypothetical protein